VSKWFAIIGKKQSTTPQWIGWFSEHTVLNFKVNLISEKKGNLPQDFLLEV
jgi:hypothetical protein